MRVATWNIWWRHGDWRSRQTPILETLRSIDADIVGLQEVCLRDPDQVAWLTDGLPDHHVVASPGGNDDRFTVVNAIVSRWPIRESEATVTNFVGEGAELLVFVDDVEGAVDDPALLLGKVVVDRVAVHGELGFLALFEDVRTRLGGHSVGAVTATGIDPAHEVLRVDGRYEGAEDGAQYYVSQQAFDPHV